MFMIFRQTVRDPSAEESTVTCRAGFSLKVCQTTHWPRRHSVLMKCDKHRSRSSNDAAKLILPLWTQRRILLFHVSSLTPSSSYRLAWTLVAETASLNGKKYATRMLHSRIPSEIWKVPHRTPPKDFWHSPGFEGVLLPSHFFSALVSGSNHLLLLTTTNLCSGILHPDHKDMFYILIFMHMTDLKHLQLVS